VKINRQKNFFLIIIIASVTLASVATILLLRVNFPYELEKYSSFISYNNNSYYFHDYDKNQEAENIRVTNDPEMKRHRIEFSNYETTGAIDWANFNHPILQKSVFFSDCNSDGYDEALIFTSAEDTIFFSLFDVYHRRFIFREVLFYLREIPNKFHDYQFVFAGIDRNSQFLYFLAASGFAVSPRGAFRFNLRSGKVDRRFEMKAKPDRPLLKAFFDIDLDGREDLFFGTVATRNAKENSGFSDDRAWFFALDGELKPLFTPLSTGGYQSTIRPMPLQTTTGTYLALLHYNAAEPHLPADIIVLNSSGNIFARKQFPGIRHIQWIPTQVSPTKTIRVLLDGIYYEFNQDLEIVDRFETGLDPSTGLTAIIESVEEKSVHYLADNSNGIILLDNKFQVIGKYGEDLGSLVAVHRRATKNLLLAEYKSGNRQSTLRISDNPFYLPGFLLFPLSFLLILLLIYLLHHFLSTLFLFMIYTILGSKGSHAIALLNRRLRIRNLNGKLTNILGLQHHIRRGEKIESAFEHYTTLIDAISHSAASGQDIKTELLINRGHKVFKGEISVKPVRSPLGFIFAYVVEILDHTEAILSDRLRTWSKGVQKIAHEIKQPLSAISLNLKAIQLRLENEPLSEADAIQADMNSIASEMQRIRALSRGFMQFSNLEPPVLQPVSFRKIIENALNHFRTFLENGVRLEQSFDYQHDFILVDESQLENVFQILVENAIDAMSAEGILSIQTSLAQYLDSPGLDFLEIEIADTGPGIRQEETDKIFEPFFTTKLDGTGLGLAIAKKIIEDHDGTISVYSRDGFGAIFRVILPLAAH
jgi:signal transduction histidine kinase